MQSPHIRFNTSNSEMETWSWRGRPIVKMVSTGVSTIGGPPTLDTGRSVDAVQDNNVGHAKVEAKTNEEVAPTETDAKAETDIVSSVFDIVDREHTGAISKRSFLKAIQLNLEVQSLLSKNDNLKCLLQHKFVHAKFEEMDENHDGKISVSEMLQFCEGPPTLLGIKVDEMSITPLTCLTTNVRYRLECRRCNVRAVG